MIFSAEATWTEDAPVPAEWMHQLGALGKEHPRWLDADRFLKTLREHSSGNESRAGVVNAQTRGPNLQSNSLDDPSQFRPCDPPKQCCHGIVVSPPHYSSGCSVAPEP